MLDLYIRTDEEYLKVPNIEENLYVDIRGRLFSPDLKGFKQLPTPNGEFTVTVNSKEYTVPVANIVQVTWKPVYWEDFIYYLTEREVWFTDDNSFNLHPINLIWGFEISKVNEMYRIPGMSWYLITEDNRIYSRRSNTILSVTLLEDRHASAYISPDNKNGIGNTITVHRLVAFAKIQYGKNVCRLDVNHIDGNKWNYATDNLEWATRRRNNIHAQMTGLKKDGNTVRVKNLLTGEVVEYYSQAKCAEEIGIDKKYLSMLLIKGNGKYTHKEIYEVEILKVGLDKPKHSTSPKIALVKNLVTGEIFEFSSMAKAAPMLGVTVAALKKRFGRGTTVFGNLHLKAYNPLLGEARPTFDD